MPKNASRIAINAKKQTASETVLPPRMRSFFLIISLKYALIILVHCVKADAKTNANSNNQPCNAAKHPALVLRLLHQKKADAVPDHGQAHKDGSNSNQTSKGTSISLLNTFAMIGMKRGDIPHHIGDSDCDHHNPNHKHRNKRFHNINSSYDTRSMDTEPLAASTVSMIMVCRPRSI